MHKPDYSIGQLVLQPHRQLLDRGVPVVIGRRALDLLSTLAEAGGGLVTKDELIAAVWPNAFVEDNAVQAQIAAARKALGAEAERLSTVRGLGYRLAAEPSRAASQFRPQAPPPAATLRAPVSPARRRLSARTVAIGAVATVAIVAAGGVFWAKTRAPPLDSVSLQAFDTAGQPPLARALATNLVFEEGAALSRAEVKVFGQDSRRRGALILGGAVRLQGEDLNLTARVEGSADHALLWSRTFSRPAAEAAAMQEQVADKLADVLRCTLDSSSYPNGRIDLPTMRLYLHACDLEHEPHASDQARDLYRQIVVRQPKFGAAWSRLAYATAIGAFDMQPQEAEAARREARRDAQVALRLNPNDGLAYEALADTGLGRLRFDQLNDLFSRGLSVQPDKPEILQDQGELLLRMGQVRDAIGELLRSSSLQPWSPDVQIDLIEARTDEGSIDAARELSERALRIWPDNARLRFVRFLIEARYGDPGVARSIIAGSSARGFALSEAQKEVFGALIAMRERRRPATAQALVRRVLTAYRAGELEFPELMLDLAQAGAVDEAFALASKRASASLQPPSLDPEFLWQPGALALRQDARFVGLAERMGIAEFWRRTGRWPDFCAAPAWPYDCKATPGANAA